MHQVVNQHNSIEAIAPVLTGEIPDLKEAKLPLIPEMNEGQDSLVQSPRISCPEVTYQRESFTEKDSYFERMRAHVKAPYVWAKGALYNAYNIARIVDTSYVRPMAGGLIDEKHPWVTGTMPGADETIWKHNVVFRTKADTEYASSDEELVAANGKFLCGMVKKSASSERHPEGAPRVDEHGTVLRRLPHAINYIHGSSQYNAGIMIFNTFEEAFHYFNNKAFRDEVRRFVEEEKREISILFRNKDYDPKEFGELGCMLRTAFKWYSNTNGPKDQVHWGSRVPVPAINMITGKFFEDLKALGAGEKEAICREPIPKGTYFKESYDTKVRKKARPAEKLFSKALNIRLQLRNPKKGNLFFVDKQWIDKKKELQRAPIVDRIKDDATGKTWSVRRQSFKGKHCDVHDVSRVSNQEASLMPLPPDFNPARDVILAFDGKTHHAYVKAGDKELHGTMFYRRKGASVKDQPSDQIKGHTAIIIKDLGESAVRDMIARMDDYEGAGSLSCSQLAMKFLEDSGVHLKTPAHSSAAVHALYDGALGNGFVDVDGKSFQRQVLRIRQDQSLEEVSSEIRLKRDARFAVLAPFGLIRGWFQKTLHEFSGNSKRTVLGL